MFILRIRFGWKYGLLLVNGKSYSRIEIRAKTSHSCEYISLLVDCNIYLLCYVSVIKPIF